MKSRFAFLALFAVVATLALMVDPAATHVAFAATLDPSSLILAVPALAVPEATAELLTRAAGTIERVATDQKAAGQKISELEQRNGELQARTQAIEQLVVKLEQGGGMPAIACRSIGALVLGQLTDDSQFAAATTAAGRGSKGGAFQARANLDLSIRAALTGDGSASSNGNSMPSQPERGGLVGPVQRPLRLLDLLPSRPTTSDSVEFIQLHADGEASEQIAEGDPKAQVDLEGILQVAPIATIAAWTSASKQVLADHAGLSAAIDRIMQGKVLDRLEHQLVNGAGGQGEIDGLLNQAATTVPTIGASSADIVGEVLSRMRSDGYTPSLVLMNPNDWFELSITRSVPDGTYLFGSPTNPIAPALWNCAVVTTPSVPQGTGIALDGQFVSVLDREQANVMVSNSHEDYFVRNLVAILGELRAGLEVLDTWAVRKFDLTPVSS